jgi:hypothetical protein
MDNDIEILWLPAHSSDQTQLFDVSLFWIVKRALTHCNVLDSVTIQTDHIAKVLNSFCSSATPHNIIKLFCNNGYNIQLEADCLSQIVCQIQIEIAQKLRLYVPQMQIVDHTSGVESEYEDELRNEL